MAVLSVMPYWTIEDADGNPISGGMVYTYAAGTTTPKAAYTDASGTQSLTNPVVADAAGRVVLWLDGSYKFIVTDASGVPIKTIDNVTAFTASAISSTQWQNVVYKVFADSPITITAADAGKLFMLDTSGGNIVVNLPITTSVTTTPQFLIGSKKFTTDANTVTYKVATGSSDNFLYGGVYLPTLVQSLASEITFVQGGAGFTNWIPIYAQDQLTQTASGCQVTNSTAQSVGTATWTTLTFDTETYKDVSTMHSTTTNPSRLIANVAGRFLAEAVYNIVDTANGGFGVRLIKNGATTGFIPGTGIPAYSGGGPTGGILLNTSWVFDMAANDYIEMQAFDATAGHSTVPAGTAFQFTRVK